MYEDTLCDVFLIGLLSRYIFNFQSVEPPKDDYVRDHLKISMSLKKGNYVLYLFLNPPLETWCQGVQCRLTLESQTPYTTQPFWEKFPFFRRCLIVRVVPHQLYDYIFFNFPKYSLTNKIELMRPTFFVALFQHHFESLKTA